MSGKWMRLLEYQLSLIVIPIQRPTCERWMFSIGDLADTQQNGTDDEEEAYQVAYIGFDFRCLPIFNKIFARKDAQGGLPPVKLVTIWFGR
jgi:hypothetical protein